MDNKAVSCTAEGWVHSFAETGETEVEDMYGNVEIYRTWRCNVCGTIGISAKPKRYEDDQLVFVHEVEENPPST